MPTSEVVMGGSAGASRRPGARESKNSPTIRETDLPRWLASVLAVRTSAVSMRNVSFVFMPYTLLKYARLVNLVVFGRRRVTLGDLGSTLELRFNGFSPQFAGRLTGCQGNFCLWRKHQGRMAQYKPFSRHKRRRKPASIKHKRFPLGGRAASTAARLSWRHSPITPSFS
jgi:hypothetical protein